MPWSKVGVLVTVVGRGRDLGRRGWGVKATVGGKRRDIKVGQEYGYRYPCGPSVLTLSKLDEDETKTPDTHHRETPTRRLGRRGESRGRESNGSDSRTETKTTSGWGTGLRSQHGPSTDSRNPVGRTTPDGWTDWDIQSKGRVQVWRDSLDRMNV